MKHILVTGSAGFIGSNFVPYFLDKYSDYFLVSLDALTYAGSVDKLAEVHGHARHKFIEGDICDAELLKDIFSRYDIRGVIHFAAESHVDNSIANPDVFIKTNINGTFSLLEAAYKYWMQKPFVCKDGYRECRFHHISTDEVYGSLGKSGLFTEMTSYAPNSPYSASKAASDMLVRSYHHTYGLNTIITNCSNNYGPKQHYEKLIPTIIRNAVSGKPIPIYGDGSNVRDWLYVLDHCAGVDTAYHNGVSGETYNIGGNNERTNNDIVKSICLLLDTLRPREDGRSYLKQITYIADRPGHDQRYAIDATKIKNSLGWEPKETFDSGIIKTINYYLANI